MSKKRKRKYRKPKHTVKLFVSVPVMEVMHSDSALALMEMVQTLHQVPRVNDIWIHSFRIHMIRTSILSMKREDALKAAREGGYTHLLFIDSDMTFPPDTAHSLLSWQKPIVAANCCIKVFPTAPTARRFVDFEKRLGQTLIETTRTKADNHDAEYCDMVGTGIMLLDLKAIEKIEPGNFPVTWDSGTGNYQGEDWNFLLKIRQELGIRPLIDHYVSWNTLHLGQFGWGHELYCNQEEMRRHHVQQERSEVGDEFLKAIGE